MASHHLTQLPNGLFVVTIQRPLQTAFVGVFNRVGARNETEAENGISHFLEHMAFKGTTSRSSKDIVFEVETLGSEINAYTSKAVTAYYVNGLPEHIDQSLDILSDIMLNSTMPPEEIAREKNVVTEEIYQSLDDISDIAMDAMMATAFPDQALGRPILGTVENVESFTQEGLLSYMKRHYHATNMVVVGIGPIIHDEFVEMVSERFSALQMRDASFVDQARYVGGTTVVTDPRFEQTHMFISFEAPGAFDEGYERYELLADVLGSGMSAPLFQKVREEKGLCYMIHSGMMSGRDTSLFIIAGACSAENIDPMISTAYGELVKIANGELSDADFNRARNQIRIQTLSMLDKPSLLAGQIVESLFYNNGVLVTPEEKIERFAAVTKEDLIATAKAMVASKSTLVVAGNVEQKEYALAA